MSLSLLQPPTNDTPHTSLNLSQQARAWLRSQRSWLSSIPYPLSLFVNTESPEKWQTYENLFLACLRTGDNDTALFCLQELTTRFGTTNERVSGFWGLYHEATAEDPSQLQEVMKQYEDVLKEDPSVFSVRKRRAALLRSVGKTNEAITALTNLLDTSPIDAEAWSELGDLYLTQGAYEQAVFCFEEVLLVTPNAWNVHAKLGEVLCLSAGKMEGSAERLRMLADSMRRFCRSVELCDDYLRGYYGLKLTSSRLLEDLGTTKKSQQSTSDPLTGDIAPPTIDSVRRLNELATTKLAEIVRKGSSGEQGWDGYNESELIAVRELLDRDTPKITR